MRIELSPEEVVEIAVRFEEMGEKFYRGKAEILPQDAREIFLHLAEEEIKHKETFQKLLKTLSPSRESLPDTYIGFLKSFVDRLIFPGGKLNLELPQVKDTISALEFAIRRELESILYYQEIKPFISSKHHSTLDWIINEEKRHFEILSKLKEKEENK